jgi:hypothetical protein
MDKSTDDKIAETYMIYVEENVRFKEKGVKASAARARKALGELRKLAGLRRKEIQEEKAALVK